MKKKLIAALAAAVIAFTMVGCNTTQEVKKERDVTINYSNPAVRYAARADQMAKATLDKYIDWEAYNQEGEDFELYLYGEHNPFTGNPDGLASVWHYTAVIGMTNRLVALNKDNEEKLNYYKDINANLIKELAWYRGTGEITNYNGTSTQTMYGVNRGRERDKATITGDQAVYDDQMWIIRETIAAYKNTGNVEFLEEAEHLTDVCLNGWNVSRDGNGNEWGGITWGPYYSSFHTCSNAPIIKSLCDLAALYKDKTDKISEEADAPTKYQYYLDWAKKVYDFTYTHLKNSDNTYADAFWTSRETKQDASGKNYFVTTAKNNTDPKAYTYNVGAMISGGAELYKLTNETKYLDDARTSAEAAYHMYKIETDKGVSNLPSTSTVWFNLVLLQGYIDLSAVSTDAAEYIDSFAATMDYAYNNYYYNGFLPRNYVEGWVNGSRSYDVAMDVMDAAANAEMYGMLSQYYNK